MNSGHPRACGERERAVDIAKRVGGSSPRLRGTAEGHFFIHVGLRVIPAPAGNGAHRYRRCPTRTGHPRACGERPVFGSLSEVEDGSSPRLRGTAPAGATRILVCRVIPAPAGNGRGAAQCRPGGPGHPRACGERFRWMICIGLSSGSSPRLRGTALPYFFDEVMARVIPAPAGNGCQIVMPSPPQAGHPRACGERCGCLCGAVGYAGSSPRLRGTDQFQLSS
ncbi:hypothetical protein SAMN05444515_101343 [Ectothiorhodospira marina]|uniref:Uncharacterized protein n=1 Tax=Ectothiorhodospira marina TaxID=1396821 RepID=A0A1H7FU36_9GAMM|nr:hypothetical protein SAMN05444515_101343 [Ectothiorhodospira marina]